MVMWIAAVLGRTDPKDRHIVATIVLHHSLDTILLDNGLLCVLLSLLLQGRGLVVVASIGNPRWGTPDAFALAFLHALALSLALARVPAQCCCIGLEGLPLLVEVVLLALGLVVRLLTLTALVVSAWFVVVAVVACLVALMIVGRIGCSWLPRKSRYARRCARRHPW